MIAIQISFISGLTAGLEYCSADEEDGIPFHLVIHCLFVRFIVYFFPREDDDG